MLRSVRLPVISILLALAVGDAAARPEPRDRTRTIQHRQPASVPVWGLADAPVTVDFFFNPTDYQLPSVWRNLMKLSADHPHRLRIRFHMVDGQWLAITALEANAQGRFFELMDEVVTNPMLGRTPTRRQELCEKAGVDFARVERAELSSWHLDGIDRAKAFMYRRRVGGGRMALLFNGKQTINTPDRMDPVRLEEAYDAALERAQELVDNGVDPHRVYARLLRDIDLAQPPARIVLGQVDGFLNRRRPVLRKERPIRLGALSMRGHRRGPEDARVVVHFFGSMQSRICTQTARYLEDLRKEFDGEMAYVFHDLYDAEDSSQPSVGLAHQLLRCAEDQGAYWEQWDQHVRQITQQLTRAKHLVQEDMEAAAKGIDIDPEKLIECMGKGRHEVAVDREIAAARAAGITRTPSVVLGGTLYEGSMSQESMRALILEQLLPGVLEEWAPTDDDRLTR
jgi:protein-disulfide isomerase